ncbi:MAG: 6,7-dimethyl-8-ribityllumazine synthase [Spirochaetota bacterium]
MQISDRHYNEPIQDHTLRVAVITALFNEEITTALEKGALEQLAALAVDTGRIQVVRVPGAWELPYAAGRLFKENRADAVIACGCVIRGETSHYDIVAGESASGLMRVSLDFSRPVMNAVLTVENTAQAQARCVAGPANKGAEAARSLVELVNAFSGAR